MSVQRRPRTGKDKNGRVTWIVRWRDSSGRESSKSYKTEREAKQADAEIKNLQRSGQYDVNYNRKITLEQYFTETVLTRPIKEQSRTRYKAFLASYINHGIGTMKLVGITKLDCQDYYNSLVDEGFSQVTVNNNFVFLRGVLSEAHKDGIIPKNPARGVRVVTQKDDSIRRSDIPTDDEIKKIIHRAQTGGGTYRKSDKQYTLVTHDVLPLMIQVAVMTGLRVSEICGLVKSDIDLDHRIINVRFQKAPTTAERVSLKSSTSARSVPYPDVLHEALLSRLSCLKDNDFVFTNKTGNPFHAGYISSQLRRVCQAEGIREFTFHPLRHYYASKMIAAGCPVNILSKMLGHSDSTITMKVYVHLLDNSTDVARGITNRIFTI